MRIVNLKEEQKKIDNQYDKICRILAKEFNEQEINKILKEIGLVVDMEIELEKECNE